MWVRVPGGELHSVFFFLSFFLRVIFYQFEPAGNGSDNTFSMKDVNSDLVEKARKIDITAYINLLKFFFLCGKNVEIKGNFK